MFEHEGVKTAKMTSCLPTLISHVKSNKLVTKKCEVWGHYISNFNQFIALKMYSCIFLERIPNVDFSPSSNVLEAHFQDHPTLENWRLQWTPLYKIFITFSSLQRGCLSLSLGRLSLIDFLTFYTIITYCCYNKKIGLWRGLFNRITIAKVESNPTLKLYKSPRFLIQLQDHALSKLYIAGANTYQTMLSTNP